MRSIRRLEELIAKLSADIRKAFLEAIGALRSSIDVPTLVKALEAGDVAEAMRLVGLEPARFRPIERQLFVAYETAGLDITVGIDRVRRSNVQALFDINEPAAAQWIKGHTTDLIRQITDDQRRLIETAFAPLHSGIDPLISGDTPQKLALDLVGRVNRVTGKREGGFLGLTSQQAEWARNYEAELQGVPDAAALGRNLRDRRFDKAIRKAIASGEPLPEKTRLAAANAYRNRALRYRAEAIAGNEAHVVTIQAQTDAWEQASDRGALEGRSIRRRWITREDARVRPTHAAIPGMNPKGVGLKEPFKTPIGPTMQPGWSFEPGCRCMVHIFSVED